MNNDLEDIANRVIRGDFGNGEDRVKALREAGYCYEEVQNRVNELLGASVPVRIPKMIGTSTPGCWIVYSDQPCSCVCMGDMVDVYHDAGCKESGLLTDVQYDRFGKLSMVCLEKEITGPGWTKFWLGGSVKVQWVRHPTAVCYHREGK